MKSVSNRNRTAAVLLLVTLGVGCQKSSSDDLITSKTSISESTYPEAPVQVLQFGEWNSINDNISKIKTAALNVSESGANLELGCASGTISGTIVLDSSGSFQVEGLISSQGGAEPIDGFPSSKALFKGQVTGDKLFLSYQVEGSETTNEIELTYGPSDGLLIRCL